MNIKFNVEHPIPAWVIIIFKKLLRIFEENKELLREAGWEVCDIDSPKWWKGVETEEELVISAILVQLSKWEAVVEAIRNLRANGLTSLEKIAYIGEDKLAELIKPVGLRKIKARRLKDLARKIVEYGGLDSLRKLGVKELRNYLLSIEGVGRETADAIILFAFNKPSFPASKYVREVLSKIGVIKGNEDYETLRKIVLREIGNNIYELKLLYAGLTSIGRLVCKKKPKCNKCPLKEVCTVM